MMEEVTTIIPTTPFSFSECLRFLQRSDLESVFHVEKNTVRLLLHLEGKQWLVEIAEQSPGIEVRVLGSQPDTQEWARIIRYINDWWDLEIALPPFYQMTEKDALLHLPGKRYCGLRLIGLPNLMEAIGWAIIGQQINLTFAYTLKKRLVEHYGESILYEGKSYFTFPQPAVIAALKEEDLRPLQFSRSKARYLIGVARALVEQKLTKAQLEQSSYESAKTQLIQLKGIGPWTADYVLMKCLRFPDAFPIADVGLHNAIKHQMNLSQKPAIETIEKMSEAWTGWKSYATFYLWHSLLDT